jgi:MYXO-CTERM domain-containing protein
MRSINATLAALLVTTAALLVPLNVAPAAAQTNDVGEGILQLYLAPAGALSFDAPTSTTVTKKSAISSTPATPGLSTSIIHGTIKAPHDFLITSDMAITVYLSAETQTVVTQVGLAFMKGSTAYTASTPSSSTYTLTTAVTTITLTVPTRNVAVKTDDVLGYRLIVFAPSAQGTATEVYLHYGYEAAPSRVVASTNMPIDAPGAIGVPVKAFFMAPTGLTFEVPSAATDTRRPLIATTMATATSSSYGSVVLETDIEVIGDSVITLWLGLEGTAAAMRGFGASLKIGSVTKTASYGTIAHTFTSTTSAYLYRFSFPTTGTSAKAGDKIEILLQTWTSSDTDAGKLAILTGGATRPSGVMIPVKELGPKPKVSMAIEGASEANATAGGTAAFALNLTNTGTGDGNVTLNVTGNVSATLAQPILVAAGQTVIQALALKVNESEAANTTLRVEVVASIDGKSVGNVTFYIHVIAGAPAGSGGTDGSSGSGGSDGGPGTGGTDGSSANGTQKAAEPGKGVPGHGLAMVLVALAALVLWSRRRPA